MAPLINWSDDLKSVDVLTDPNAADIVAKRLQASTKAPAQIEDLGLAITDIELEWVVQGSPTLTIHLDDPNWILIRSRFIDVDDTGMLLPLEINYPEGTDCWWWLAAIQAQLDPAQANITLTFEDRVVAKLREATGAQTSGNGQTLADFIRQLVRRVPEARFYSPSWQQEQAALAKVGVDPKTIASLNPANPVSSPPASSKAPGASPARKNPTKGRSATGSRNDPGSATSIGATALLTGVLSIFGSPPVDPGTAVSEGTGSIISGIFPSSSNAGHGAVP